MRHRRGELQAAYYSLALKEMYHSTPYDGVRVLDNDRVEGARTMNLVTRGITPYQL